MKITLEAQIAGGHEYVCGHSALSLLKVIIYVGSGYGNVDVLCINDVLFSCIRQIKLN